MGLCNGYLKNGGSRGKELARHDQELATVFIKVAHPSLCNVNWACSCQPLCIDLSFLLAKSGGVLHVTINSTHT